MNKTCEHLMNLADGNFPPPRTQNLCEECIKLGTTWVALRACLTCGHVGCCDSSPGKHATKHYHETHHPVIRSIMPGEQWTWCYAHEVTGELPAIHVKNNTESRAYEES